MRKIGDIVGTIHGWLTITATELRGAERFVKVDCACGTQGHWTRWGNVREGTSASCGCLRRARAAGLNKSHGYSANGATRLKRSTYDIWHSMKQRCHWPGFRFFARYGGRGITVCPVWRESFQAFLDDMGPRPSSHHSLDRIDNNGNYEPGNVRWATPRQQANNKITNRRVVMSGRTQTVSEWAREYGFTPQQVFHRLALGWTLDRAVSTPIRHAPPSGAGLTSPAHQAPSRQHRTR